MNTDLIDEIWNDLQEYQNETEPICKQINQKNCINKFVLQKKMI